MKEMRWAATISDISLGGVRVLLARRFEKNAGLAIELPGTDERESTVVFAKVVHVRSQGNGTWALGCKFLSELSDDQLQSLLTSTKHALSSATRPSDEAVLTHLLVNVHLKIEIWPGSIVHCIIKRLNATKCWPLNPGKVLGMKGKTPDQTPWTLRLRITRFCRTKAGWELQGRLVDSPAAAKMLHTLRGK
jgi:PilZ domain